MEQLNSGNEAVKSSKRRISSILKAPRASMRVSSAEQEEQQEEITKPVEKKRNSRRVSFATTNNVHVFTKDVKSESPVLSAIQNITVGDSRQDEKVLHFVGEGNHQIKGLETLLNNPLYVSQHLNKESFFSDPVLEDDCVDRTVLLGDDTGCMDMTQSHTITIDEDYDINNIPNSDFGLKVAQTVGGSQNDLPRKAKIETKDADIDADFNAFLASISLPTVQNIAPSSSKKEIGGLFCSTDASISAIDKENLFPSFLKKQVKNPVGNGNPQPRGLQRRRSRVAFLEGDDMDSTRSHTVVIENEANVQPVPSSVSKNHGRVTPMTAPFSNNLDDMELTQSQTAAINVKVTGNITCNVQSALDQNRSYFFSENDNAMEMTGAFDQSVRERDHTVNMKGDAPHLVSFNVLGNGEITDRNNATIHQSNVSVGQTAYSDDMEMTEALDVSVQDEVNAVSMKKEAFTKVNKMSSFNVFGNGEITDRTNRELQSSLSVAQTDNSDDMEMTQCQTIVFETKKIGGNKSFSNSRKSLPHASVVGTEGSDGMDITQAFTGRIILNSQSASKTGRAESVQTPLSSWHNQSDCMDLTGQPNISAGMAPPSPDEMELTGCRAVAIDSDPTWLRSAPDITARRSAPLSANRTINMVVPMEMTEVHMYPFSERKHKGFRRKSSCDLENTQPGNGQITFSIPDDMEMTQCQTIVLEAECNKKGKPVGKPRKSLNLGSSSFSPDVDCMEMTQALTGQIMLKSLINSEGRKAERNLSPAAQCYLTQDQTDRMDLTCQTITSSVAIPSVDDEMELTGCNTIAIDAKNNTTASTAVNKANEHTLWASTSFSRCSMSRGEQKEMTEAARGNINQGEVFLSKETAKSNKSISYGFRDNQVEKNCDISCPSNVSSVNKTLPLTMTSESFDDDNMQVTNVFTMPIETQHSVSFNHREITKEHKETLSVLRNKVELEEEPWPRNEQSTNSVRLDVSSSTGTEADSVIKQELRHTKSRRRSLADFQIELQNMSRRINEQQEVMIGSATAPLPSCYLSETRLNGKDAHETTSPSEPASNVTPNCKQKYNSVQNEKTTPFSLKKKPFSSRLSLCGIVPKLPKRATATPNKTVTITANVTQCLSLDQHLDVNERNSNSETVNINDEELPEMSSEEDLSGSLENWPINKKDEQNDSLAQPKNESSLEDDVFESVPNISQGLKRLYPEEGSDTAEQTKKAYISDMGSECHEAGVQWEGNFASHVAQNPKAKTIEDTGVSESTFRYSQCDSHLDGTMNHEFDFNKKLEDGSITVNEFLNHFGINFVIHRSRPSALPERCSSGETRTMEDLLKEKYIYHPKQRVYEQNCKNLTDIVERLKTQIPEQEKSLRFVNEALHQEICTLSKEQLQSFGSKLKERRVYFGKRSKALSHEMKGVLYSELIKTTQDANQNLRAKIKETDEMLEDLDGCINDLETELAAIDAMNMEDHHDALKDRPALKAKEEDLQRLNSAATEREREICELQIQLASLEGQQEKLRGETKGLKSHLATLNSLNEWRLDETDENGALFTFLHNTVHLQVKLHASAGKEWMTEDVERNIDVSCQLQLDVEKSECHASMVHKLLSLNISSQTQWNQRYPTTRHIPKLLHDVSLMVSRLRLLGEEIHRLKKWGALRLHILKITCVDTQVHVVFSSLKAFEKFELSLAVTPDYPFGPLQIQDFKNHIGNTRLSQIEDIASSIKPAKNYLTEILKKIHDNLLC